MFSHNICYKDLRCLACLNLQVLLYGVDVTCIFLGYHVSIIGLKQAAAKEVRSPMEYLRTEINVLYPLLIVILSQRHLS